MGPEFGGLRLSNTSPLSNKTLRERMVGSYWGARIEDKANIGAPLDECFEIVGPVVREVDTEPNGITSVMVEMHKVITPQLRI